MFLTQKSRISVASMNAGCFHLCESVVFPVGWAQVQSSPTTLAWRDFGKNMPKNCTSGRLHRPEIESGSPATQRGRQES